MLKKFFFSALFLVFVGSFVVAQTQKNSFYSGLSAVVGLPLGNDVQLLGSSYGFGYSHYFFKRLIVGIDYRMTNTSKKEEMMKQSNSVSYGSLFLVNQYSLGIHVGVAAIKSKKVDLDFTIGGFGHETMIVIEEMDEYATVLGNGKIRNLGLYSNVGFAFYPKQSLGIYLHFGGEYFWLNDSFDPEVGLFAGLGIKTRF